MEYVMAVHDAFVQWMAQGLLGAAWWQVLLFAGFAFLAVRHVRNQGLFYATLPLLIVRPDRD